MTFRSTSLMLLAVLAACGAAAGAADKSDTTATGALAEDAALPGTFGSIASAVELADGRVVFVDVSKRTVHVGDFAKGTTTVLGTHDDSLKAGGPADVYKFPGAAVHLGGDTVAIVDLAATRTNLFGEDGTARGVWTFAPIGGNTPVLAYDHQGHGYKVDYQTILGGSEPGSRLRPDSIPVLRLTPGSATADTVAFYGAPEYGEAVFGEQIQQVAKIFSPNDYFGVTPDGALWVARGRRNAVDWREPDGTWTVGKGRDYAKLPVTDDDKARVMQRLRERGLPQGVPVTFPFEEFKPPFELAFGRADGTVWLQRPRASEDAAYVFDVWGRDGIWQREVALPTGVTLLGFGKQAAYGAKKVGEQRQLVRFALR
jgi:hypothetical protein